MTFSADPYRTLGLVPGAPVDDVKRAYRRLAKRYHPDSAGEIEVRRFLAIQAAYEQILARADGATQRPTGPRAPWDADPARARATRGDPRRRSRSRAGWSASGWSGGSWWSAGRPDGSGRPAGDPSAGGPRGGAAGSTGAEAGGRRKATLHSTSYDEAAHEPFEPSWGGAGWYGASSGTYWTINPREYADPRKHGPEYQARARRSSGARDDAHQPASGPASDGAGPASSGWPASGPAGTARSAAGPAPGRASGRATVTGAPPGASDAPATVGLLAGLIAVVPASIVLLGTAGSGGDLLLPALLAPVVVGVGAALVARRTLRR